jgi:nitrous-oxide reductase
MQMKGRAVALLVLGFGACVLAGPAALRLRADAHPGVQPAPAAGQEQAPNRREFTVTARDYRFSPSRLEVTQDDLVKLTVQSLDVAYSLTIDEYRLSRRVPAGGTATIEFRADRSGTFSFYSNMSNDARHAQMRGTLVVRTR